MGGGGHPVCYYFWFYPLFIGGAKPKILGGPNLPQEIVGGGSMERHGGESTTLNLAQRSFKVIHFGGNRRPVYDWPLIVVFTIFNRYAAICRLYTPEPTV